MDLEYVPVVWGVDKKYVLPAFVVMHSILMCSNLNYSFYILTSDDITDQVQEYGTLLHDKYNNFDVSVKRINQDVLANVKVHNQHLSKATYFRLLIPNLLSECDKCIYLDSDILVNGDLNEFFYTEMGDNYIAGVKDCHIIENTIKGKELEEVLGLPSRKKYINAGVMLMNLKKLREDALVEKFLVQMSKENWYEDQDVLNVCCYPHIKILPLKYNLFHFYCGKNISLLKHLDYEKQDFDFTEPLIIHIGGRWKPWNNRKIKYADKWWSLADIFKTTEYYKRYWSQSLPRENIDILFEEMNLNRTKQIVIWGYTRNGKFLCDVLLANEYTNIISFADNDLMKWGEEYRGIPVMGIDEVLKNWNNIFWVISNQVAFNEVKQQILSCGINENNITSYKNCFRDKLYLLSLDKAFYDLLINQIAMIEYTKEFSEFTQRKQYILKIILGKQNNKEQYLYLKERYNFQYWINMEYENV